MQIVPSTFLALLLVIGLAARGPVRGLWIFFAATPLGAAAAFNLPAVGGATIGVLDLAAVTVFALACLVPDGPARIAGTMRPGQPGFTLALLGIFCIVSALIFPRLFEGQTETFSLSRANNETRIVSVRLAPTTGNLTQAFRITLGVLTFLALATFFRWTPRTRAVIAAVITATVVHFTLGWLDVLTAATGMEALLEPIRTANYAMLTDHRMVGLKRMVGGFPEASSFGAYTLGLCGFWLQYWIAAPRSRIAPWMLAASLLLLLRSTSSAAYVSLIVFLVVFACIAVARGVGANVGRRSFAIAGGALVVAWFAALVLFSAYEFVDPVTAFLDRSLFGKLETASGEERMAWNAQALRNFTDTMLMGAGLGSVRASNWLVACLGSIGVIGTGLYLVFLWQVFRVPSETGDHSRDTVIRSIKAACLALLTNAMLTKSTPDLDIIFFALAGLAAGLSRGGVLEMGRRLAGAPGSRIPGVRPGPAPFGQALRQRRG